MKLVVSQPGKNRNVTRTFKVAPRRPRITGVAKRGRARLVKLRLYSRAKVNGRVERLSGGRFVRVHQTTPAQSAARSPGRGLTVETPQGSLPRRSDGE